MTDTMKNISKIQSVLLNMATLFAVAVKITGPTYSIELIVRWKKNHSRRSRKYCPFLAE
jgi:hypothetical protein